MCASPPLRSGLRSALSRFWFWCVACLVVGFSWSLFLGCAEQPPTSAHAHRAALDTTTERLIVDYPRQPRLFFDILPVSSDYDSASQYLGISAPWSGDCHALPVHGYRWGDDFAARDTTPLRLDFWVTGDCPGSQWYDELRVFIPTDPRIESPAAVSVETHHLSSGTRATSYSLVWTGSYEWVVSPTSICRQWPQTQRMAATRPLVIGQFWSCYRDRPDTLHVTVTIGRPVLKPGNRCGPRPFVVGFELTNTNTSVSHTETVAVAMCSL